MIDKSWMLNPHAIRYAKTCIQIIRQATDQKITLSQADFLQQLEGYSKKLRSDEFTTSYRKLISMAKDGNGYDESRSDAAASVQKKETKLSAVPLADMGSADTVTYAGKQYPKWHEGKEFKGLYRGQPLYR